MTESAASKCHRITRQPLKLCDAYVRAGLSLSQISSAERVTRLGLTTAEDAALEKFYRHTVQALHEAEFPKEWAEWQELEAREKAEEQARKASK